MVLAHRTSARENPSWGYVLIYVVAHQKFFFEKKNFFPASCGQPKKIPKAFLDKKFEKTEYFAKNDQNSRGGVESDFFDETWF